MNPPAYPQRRHRNSHPGFAGFQRAILPLLDEKKLLGLREALVNNDKRFVQGYCVKPSGFNGFDQEVEGACLLGFIGILAGCKTNGDVNRYFDLVWQEIHEKGLQEDLYAFLTLWDGYDPTCYVYELVEMIDEELQQRSRNLSRDLATV